MQYLNPKKPKNWQFWNFGPKMKKCDCAKTKAFGHFFIPSFFTLGWVGSSCQISWKSLWGVWRFLHRLFLGYWPHPPDQDWKKIPPHLFTALALPFSNILIHNIAKKLPSDPTQAIDVKKKIFHHFSQIYKRGHISGPSGLSEKKFGGFYFHMGSKKMA